ncbi:hypothetical protein IO402_000545 [Campylobacter lari]|nr:hypothetical protein [Campylobacter lari]
MIEETLEKILHTLEKCCKKTHQSNKSESGENKSKISSQEATSIKEKLSEVLSIDKQYIFDLSDKKTLEIIKEKEDFRQRDELFSDNEKWYLIYDKGGSKIDISLSYDRIKSIPSNIIFNNCNIDLYMNKPEDTGKDNIETIKNHLYFYNCTFEKVLIKLKNIIFEKTLTFDQCAFYNDLKIYQNQFLDHLVFLNCYDKQNDIKITSLDLQENKFEGYLFIKNCAIKNINLWKNKFENRCYFVDSKFEYENKDNTTKLNFSNTHFEDEVYFNNSEFYSYADFHECKFDNTACFYGVKFYKVPNFSACYFKEQKAANLINVDIDELNFESVEKYIEDNYQDETYENKQEVIEEQRNNSCKLKCAKHLKDSFRVIKDVLISQNNILEAQEWHKLELYAKEKETMIKATSINDNIDSKNTTAKFLKEELYNFTEWINFTLLFVYRNTSSHHTSFLKILNFTVAMIALYASFVWWLQIDNTAQTVYEFIFKTAFKVVVIIAFLLYITYKSTFKLRIFRFFLFLGMCCCIFLLFLFQNPKFIIIYCYILWVSFFSWIFFYVKLLRFFVLTLAYIVFFGILITRPQFINPFIGVFSLDKLYESKIEKTIQDLNSSSILNLAKISHKDFNLSWHYQDVSFVELDVAKKLIIENKDNILDLKEQNLTIATEFLGKKYIEISKAIKQDKITSNVIRSTSVLYSIILLLCIFSLQKTARKNSIVPS